MGALYSNVFQLPDKSNVSEYVQTDVTFSTDVDDSMFERDLGSEPASTPHNQHIRTSLMDPRSATIGIVRTPILIVTTDDSSSGCQTPKAAPVTLGQYLETDVDAVITSSTASSKQLASQAEGQDSDDQEEVESSSQLESSQGTPFSAQENSKVSSIGSSASEQPSSGSARPFNSFLVKLKTEEEMPVSSDDEEMVGDKDRQSMHPQEMFYPQARTITRRELDVLKKKLFLSPEPTNNAITPESIRSKGRRMPLGMVCHNKDGGVVISPSMLGSKRPWKGIAEERRKLGLENTPPPSLQPPPELPQSAPASRSRSYKHQAARWDLADTSVLI